MPVNKIYNMEHEFCIDVQAFGLCPRRYLHAVLFVAQQNIDDFIFHAEEAETMYPSEVASLKAVKEALADVDSVCERCMLRFAGIKNSRSCKADNFENRISTETTYI